MYANALKTDAATNTEEGGDFLEVLAGFVGLNLKSKHCHLMEDLHCAILQIFKTYCAHTRERITVFNIYRMCMCHHVSKYQKNGNCLMKAYIKPTTSCQI